MKKHEQRWNTILNQYLREKQFYCFYELKQTGNQKVFNFAKIEKEQWTGLQATEKNGLVWKLSDDDCREKPCDGFSIPPLPSYLIIKFAHEFCVIRFEEIVKLRDEGVISISLETARNLSEKIIKL